MARKLGQLCPKRLEPTLAHGKMKGSDIANAPADVITCVLSLRHLRIIDAVRGRVVRHLVSTGRVSSGVQNRKCHLASAVAGDDGELWPRVCRNRPPRIIDVTDEGLTRASEDSNNSHTAPQGLDGVDCVFDSENTPLL